MHLTFPGQLGFAVRSARKAYGLTQEELAGIAGVSDRTVRAIERGRGTVALGTVVRVARHVGLELTLQDAVLWPHHLIDSAHTARLRALLARQGEVRQRLLDRDARRVRQGAEALRPVREASQRHREGTGWGPDPDDGEGG